MKSKSVRTKRTNSKLEKWKEETPRKQQPKRPRKQQPNTVFQMRNLKNHIYIGREEKRQRKAEKEQLCLLWPTAEDAGMESSATSFSKAMLSSGGKQHEQWPNTW